MTSPSRANWPRKTGATAIAAALVVGSAPMGGVVMLIVLAVLLPIIQLNSFVK